MKLDEFLNQHHVPFERLPHPPAFTANRVARILHVPGKEVAKTVLLRADDQYVLVVLPATRQVDLQRVAQEMNAQRVELATEAEIAKVFPDCEPGAIPPFGSLYHLTTLVDEALTEDDQIVFEGQTRQEAIRMSYRDFQEQEHPRLGHFSSSQLHDLVSRYSDRLVERVRKQLPGRLRQRIDPEDVVQSVFRSFFQRMKDGTFTFQDSQHVWRLLTVLAYHKVQTLIKHHQDVRRDVRREERHGEPRVARPDPEPGPEDVAGLEDLLQHFMKELPADQRQIVALRVEGASVSEIARKTCQPAKTIRRILTDVQQAIRRELEAAT